MRSPEDTSRTRIFCQLQYNSINCKVVHQNRFISSVRKIRPQEQCIFLFYPEKYVQDHFDL